MYKLKFFKLNRCWYCEQVWTNQDRCWDSEGVGRNEVFGYKKNIRFRSPTQKLFAKNSPILIDNDATTNATENVWLLNDDYKRRKRETNELNNELSISNKWKMNNSH